MRYDVTEHASGIDIHARGVARQVSELLESIQQCQEGQCGCPTDQYTKLSAIDIERGQDEVRVRLHPLPGERLDPDQITACLDYTTGLIDG